MAIKSGEWQYDSKGVGYKKTSTGWKKEGDSSGARYNSPAESEAYKKALLEAKAVAKADLEAKKKLMKTLQSTTFSANYDVNDVIRHEEKGMTVLYKKDGTIIGAYEPGAVVYRRGKLLVDQTRNASPGNYSFKNYNGDRVNLRVGRTQAQYSITPKERIVAERLKSYVDPSKFQTTEQVSQTEQNALENWINNRKEVIAKNSRYWRTTGENVAGKPGRVLGGLVAFGVNFVNGAPVVMAYDMVDSTGKQGEIAMNAQKIYSQGRTATPEEVEQLKQMNVDWKNTDFVLNTASGIKQDFQNDPYGAFGETVLPLVVAGAAGRTRVNVGKGGARVSFGKRGVSVKTAAMEDGAMVDLETFVSGKNGFESVTKHFNIYKDVDNILPSAIEYAGRTERINKGNIAVARSARRTRGGGMKVNQQVVSKGKNGKYIENFSADETGIKYNSLEYEMDKVGKAVSKTFNSEELMRLDNVRGINRLSPKSKVRGATKESIQKVDITDVAGEMDIVDKMLNFDMEKMTIGADETIKRGKKASVQKLNEKGTSKSLKKVELYDDLTGDSFLDFDLESITKETYDLEPTAQRSRSFKGKGSKTPLSKTFGDLNLDQMVSEVMEEILGPSKPRSEGVKSVPKKGKSVPEVVAATGVKTRQKGKLKQKSKNKNGAVVDSMFSSSFGLEAVTSIELDDIVGNVFGEAVIPSPKITPRSSRRSRSRQAQSPQEAQVLDLGILDGTSDFSMGDFSEGFGLPDLPEFPGLPTLGAPSDTGKKRKSKKRNSSKKGKTRSYEVDWFSPF